jgi:hypothetical protein
VVEQAASSTPIETRLAADGVAYSWAEFESYYFDADMAAEIWEAAEVVAAPEIDLILFANPRRNTQQSQDQTSLQLQSSPANRALPCQSPKYSR